ncbi:MAG: hypothetical protein QF578_04970 [Alphaproteobacteria bacterium]|jgi:hypothetical protein|nr:hypothetical protein [Alphaproteobacteria bacterium]MDP6812643.1 hypothetical protein [Alphaproteobacteria bacterium]
MAGGERTQQKPVAAKKGSGGRRRRDRAPTEPIVAYNSKLKLGVLAAPCVLVAIVSLIAAVQGIDILGGGRGLHFAAAFIGGLTAFTLLQMAFDQKPVLVIDDEGIRCRRPDVGLIPWPAVVGLGTSKATLMRRVLMIAVDEGELDEQAARHMRRRVGMFAAFSPQVAKFEGQMKGWPSIHVPISYFSTSPRQLEKQLAEKIHFHGKKS